MSRSRAQIVCAGLASAAFAAGGASAAVQVVSASVPLRTTNFADVLSVAKFDGSLGALTGVSIVANVGYSGRHFGENMSPTAPSQFLSRLTYTLSLSGAGLTSPVSLANVNEATGSLSANDGVYDFGGASGYTVVFSDSDQGLANLTGVDDLSAFIGSGSVQYSLTAIATSFHQGNGGAMSQGTQSQASGDVTVTYTYTLIPAPGVGATVLGGLALMTRRRR